MNIHEYQAKELLAKYGVPVPAGHAALTVDEAIQADESGVAAAAVCSRSTSTLRPRSTDADPAARGWSPRSVPAVSISTSQAAAYSSGGRVSGTSSAEALKYSRKWSSVI